jgi:hypothetical protein
VTPAVPAVFARPVTPAVPAMFARPVTPAVPAAFGRPVTPAVTTLNRTDHRPLSPNPEEVALHTRQKLPAVAYPTLPHDSATVSPQYP